ncbi:uncharacterized protein F4822DRAFT_147589 [Hypoxylon trugodes]|uniref:uncharacterized protein n=1 Tax=Hypoxylon trugodes TaxID=326681 RepID=UPI00219233D8|nr:uncharacterized protein F4822DRAFT_147589 [Hypoxylon trugodes]KAI1392985.1 hypothetical protein F4822DRAFT_147589 [Hypoxylon trugodes]
MDKMLRPLHLRVAPSILRPAIHRRRFRSCPQLNTPNYAPGPYFYPPPKSRGSRLKDIAIGSGLTISAYLAYIYYQYRQLSKEMREAAKQYEQDEVLEMEFDHAFTEARYAGDQDRLKELTFELARAISKGRVEVGPLPRLPEGDKSHGKDNIPEEDTLMFIVDHDGDSLIVHLAVNAESQEIFQSASRTDDPADQKDSPLLEIILRVNYQAAEWIREGILGEDGDLLVTINMRDRHFGFTYCPNSSRIRNQLI